VCEKYFTGKVLKIYSVKINMLFEGMLPQLGQGRGIISPSKKIKSLVPRKGSGAPTGMTRHRIGTQVFALLNFQTFLRPCKRLIFRKHMSAVGQSTIIDEHPRHFI